MKTVKEYVDGCDQGELHFRSIKRLPKSAKLREDAAAVVVGHSETGHHHSFARECGVKFYETKDPLIGYLMVSGPSLLEHHRSFDNHAAILFPPGVYEVRRRREYVSRDEQRAVAD